MIDWNRFNWPKIVGVMHDIESLTNIPQCRMMSAHILEEATARCSDGQLKYVGDTEIGCDFIGCDGLRYESKSVQGLIKKKGPTTKKITLKNYYGKCLGEPEQTFDYMIAFDSTKNTVLLADWDNCIENGEIKAAVYNTKLDINRCEVIAKDVNYVTIGFDVQQKYNDFVSSCIGKIVDEKEFVMMDDPSAIIKRVPLEGTLESFMMVA